MQHRFFATVACAPLLLVACGSDDAASESQSPQVQAPADNASDDPVADDPVITRSNAATTEAATTGEFDADQEFPDIIDAVATKSGDTWSFDVTVSSPYDTPDRYADGWRIVGPDGTELGFRELTHDHASEQPFTRTITDIEIPDDVTTVTVEGRDQANGYGGETFELTLTS